METTGKQEAEETKKSSVLLIEGEKKDDTGGEKIEPDERFFQDEPDEKDDVDEKPKQALDKNFKKQIKKENRKGKIAFARKKFSNIFRLPTVSALFRGLDFLLNLFSISSIIFGVMITAHFLMEGNPYMVVAGCIFIFITIYLNEKIS